MNIFNHEKDLILKITNLVLWIWLVTSVVLFYTAVVDLVMPRPLQTYTEYKITDCYYGEQDTDEGEKFCQSSYESYRTYEKDEKYQTKRNLFSFAGSIVIVTTVLYFLNKKKKGAHK